MIQASANCCPVDSAAVTCSEELCPIAEQLLNSADGDALTELEVDFVSEDSENGPRVQYSFNFEQVSRDYYYPAEIENSPTGLQYSFGYIALYHSATSTKLDPNFFIG